MNIFNKFFLSLVLLPASWYKKMGVDISHLRAILRIKLMMDDRRQRNTLQQARKKKKETPPKNVTIVTMLMSAIFGSVFLLVFKVGHDYLTQLTLYFSLYIFTLASTLMADFTSVLIDVRDNMIILPKPVNDKTFVLARLLHIVIHVSKLVTPMMLPGLIWISIKEGFSGGFPFALMVMSCTLFTIFLINAIYLLVLKITTPDKFKNIISYFQIGFAIVFYGGYQIVPRLIDETVMHDFSITTSAYAKFLIPYWFAAGWQFFQDFQLHTGLWIYFVLTLLLPFVSIWLVIKYFAPSFNQKLSMIGGSDSENTVAKPGAKKITSTTSKYITQVSKWITGNGAERMAFLSTWKITARSREFKMKVYPMMGYLVIYLVVLLLGNSKGSSPTSDPSKLSYLALSFIYIGSVLLASAVTQLVYSEQHKASWIYFITPVQTPGRILSGALKAMIVKFYVPILFIVYLFSLTRIGFSILPNLLLATTNQLLIVSFGGYLTLRNLPFSLHQNTNIKGGGFMRIMASMFIPFVFAIMHYMIYNNTIVVIIVGILSAIAAWMMMDAVKNKSWDKLQLREYQE